MANLVVKDQTGAAKYIKAGEVGSDADPFITIHGLAAGTNAIGKLAANSGVDIGDVDVTSIAAGDNNIGNVDIVTGPTGASALAVQGTVAHDGAAAQNPVPIAGTAVTPADSAVSGQVSADADVARVAVDRDGAVYTHPHPPRIWHVATEYTTQQTDASVKAAPGANLSLYITDIVIVCNAAVNTTIEESTTTQKIKHIAQAQGDGLAHSFRVPIKITANTAITITTSGAVTVELIISGFTAP